MGEREMNRKPTPGSPGMAVDLAGNVAYDPSANVLALVKAAVARIDDVSKLQARLNDEKVRGIQRQQLTNERHAREIRKLDTDRLEKIRQVDQSNAAAAAAQLLAAVQTLASTAATTAETLRNQVAATAAAVAAQTERVVNPIIERLAVLEKSSYTGVGKESIRDPAIADLTAEIRRLTSLGATSTGKVQGIGALAGWIAAAVSLALAALTLWSKTH